MATLKLNLDLTIEESTIATEYIKPDEISATITGITRRQTQATTTSWVELAPGGTPAGYFLMNVHASEALLVSLNAGTTTHMTIAAGRFALLWGNPTIHVKGAAAGTVLWLAFE